MQRRVLDDYVQHRLLIAGYQGNALFSRGALKQLHRASRGIPRLVNLLCHKALMAAYGSGTMQVKRMHLLHAASDTEDVVGRKPRWLAVVSGLVGLAALTSAGLLYAYSL